MAILNKGEAMLIGIGSNTYTGYIVETVDLEAAGEMEEILGEDGDADAILFSNLGTRVRLSMLAKTGQTPETVKKGDQVTINSVIYVVEDAKVNRNRKVAKFDLTLYKPASITFS